MSKKPTYADLQRKIRELEAQSATAARAALRDIDKADDRLMGSAVIVTLTALGGREIVAPFAIRDGLSPNTIQALREDIARTMTLSGFNNKA